MWEKLFVQILANDDLRRLYEMVGNVGIDPETTISCVRLIEKFKGSEAHLDRPKASKREK